MKKCLIGILLAGIAFLATSTASADYSSVVVYGDSLSDNGNFYAKTGQPQPPYYQGRRSNGPVAVEYLAASLGAPLMDFAWIGATTGVGNFADGGTVTSPGLYSLPGMLPVYTATQGALAPFLANGLFIVWGGPNDILAPSPLDTTASDIITRAVTNELGIVASLQGLGARHILVPGMPDLGLTPYFQSMGQVAAADATAFSDAFNFALHKLLPDNVFWFDTSALLRAVVANPGDYGFTNVTDACFNGISIVGDPNTYLFFDDFHPTTATHALLAREFEEAATVPEPGTILFVGGGLGCLIFLRRKSLARPN